MDALPLFIKKNPYELITIALALTFILLLLPYWNFPITLNMTNNETINCSATLAANQGRINGTLRVPYANGTINYSWITPQETPYLECQTVKASFYAHKNQIAIVLLAFAICMEIFFMTMPKKPKNPLQPDS